MIIDQTETNLIRFREKIHAEIQSSIDSERCAANLHKLNLRHGLEVRFSLK